MTDRERKQRHDDAHHPMAGRGRKAWRGGSISATAKLVPQDHGEVCPHCDAPLTFNIHKLLCPSLNGRAQQP